MASYPPSTCCTIGVKHSGETFGKIIKVGKHDAYLAMPAPEKTHKDTAILYVADIYGIWENSKLIADQYAANGYLCLIPDLFNGDQLTFDRVAAGIDLMAWINHGSDGKNPHTTEAIDPIMVAAIETLQTEYGITKFGAVGYCFGAKYVVRHYKTGIKVGFVAHPSFVTEEELAAITGPLSIAAAETDTIFPVEKRQKSEAILKKTGQAYQINLFSGVQHGFAVRCDLSVKAQRFAKEQAFLQAVAWFDEHLLE